MRDDDRKGRADFENVDIFTTSMESRRAVAGSSHRASNARRSGIGRKPLAIFASPYDGMQLQTAQSSSAISVSAAWMVLCHRFVLVRE